MTGAVNLGSLTPDEFISHLQDATYTPPSRAVVEELVQRYVDLVDADVERADAEDEAAALAATRVPDAEHAVLDRVGTVFGNEQPRGEFFLRCGLAWRPYIFTVGPGDYRVRFAPYNN